MSNHENTDLPAVQPDPTPERPDRLTLDEQGRVVQSVSFSRPTTYSYVYGADRKLISSSSSVNGSAG